MVDYARLTNVQLDPINPDYPQLRGMDDMNFGTPIDMYLYKAALSGGRCVNGQIFRQRYGQVLRLAVSLSTRMVGRALLDIPTTASKR